MITWSLLRSLKIKFMEVILMTGPPYAGKGTQCTHLALATGFKHLSTGERIRWEKDQKTPLGRLMSNEEKGQLVPDEVMEGLVRLMLEENKRTKGVILDGYPRTTAQVDTLLQILAEEGLSISKVINLQVPRSELLRRAKERARSSNRKDDQDVSIHTERISVFENETLPAITYLSSLIPIKDIDGQGTEDATKQLILREFT